MSSLARPTGLKLCLTQCETWGPSLARHRIAARTDKHDIGDILRESLSHEKKTLVEYEKLLDLVQGVDIMLEEFAREHIYLERLHIGEVDKMLRRPRDIESIDKADEMNRRARRYQ